MEIYSEAVKEVIKSAGDKAIAARHEFVTPEHVLAVLAEAPNVFKQIGKHEIYSLDKSLNDYFDSLDRVPEGVDYDPEVSWQLNQLFGICMQVFVTSTAKTIDIPHLLNAFFSLEDSLAKNVLLQAINGKKGDFIASLIPLYQASDEDFPPSEDDIFFDDDHINFQEMSDGPGEEWRRLVTCMSDLYESRNPLIGRENELQRTIQVLCRKEKNNPLHVGEPGVGKTALVWGLAAMIARGDVPERLKGAKVYMMDMTSMLAGTQFRGDFERNIKSVMDGIMAEGNNNIVYIDEIHMLVGAGATSDNAMDASNILKPYLEGGSLRFIGSTTHEEFNRQFSKSKGLVRRFQKIDIDEPSQEEAVNIIMQLQPHYEEFHGVKYSPEALRFAVESSARHIADRFLPDKAIDLIDEAGAAMEMAQRKKKIGIKEIADVLAKTCHVDALAVAEKDDYSRLKNLSARMLAQIYGQDEAVMQTVESVQMARAGLLDENKPLASLLFVGPTGVGKTEVANVLARELGVDIVRFDMSEYVEKHSVAKLIGAPAGYVGYDDGGLLTDAVRKSPNCVLLLDEIEKAHQDIYNILLQVMDYGRLTDNKGRHADFRNVILIMTSNAGAQFASQASVGFRSSVSRGSAMMKHVKRTFKPEFLNRLSGTVVFNDMNKEMATLILKKKLRSVEDKLKAKNIKLSLSKDAFEHMLAAGFTPEYGAREMDRVIRSQLSPLLMREILFGSLKKGGKVKVALDKTSRTLAIR